jgi:SAM-dependent methyltransferase
MGQETGKAIARRSHDARFVARYYLGFGIDIGSGNDSLAHYGGLFPGCHAITSWDKAQGDAMLMEGVPDNAYDFVNSSHCLEHLTNPYIAINNWIRITKPGGHLIIVVPDADLYERGKWPSEANPDHKFRFTTTAHGSRDGMVSVLDMLADRVDVRVLKIELLDLCYFYEIAPCPDQSAIPCTEPAIEIVMRKL